ncbi:MAG TPA: polysaccharide deacetylase family protein [Cyclobacteriaceae bacterium]
MLLLFAMVVLDWRIDISTWYYVLLFFIYSLIQAYGVVFVSASFFVPIKCKGERISKSVALTFDDGPLPEMTERILTILNDYQVKATFFCIGHRVEKHPEILTKIDSQGHVIGNHTFNHGKFFDLLSAKEMSAELDKTDEAIQNAIQKKPRFFRPPYGVTNPNLAKAIKRGNYITMGWSVRSLDTVAKEDEKLFQRVTKNLKGGDVILFHDYCEITIRILPRVLEYIQKQRLEIVRLDELMGEKAYY